MKLTYILIPAIIIYSVIGLIKLVNKCEDRWGMFILLPWSWIIILFMIPMWPLWLWDLNRKIKKDAYSGCCDEFGPFYEGEEGADFGFRRNDTPEQDGPNIH